MVRRKFDAKEFAEEHMVVRRWVCRRCYSNVYTLAIPMYCTMCGEAFVHVKYLPGAVRR